MIGALVSGCPTDPDSGSGSESAATTVDTTESSASTSTTGETSTASAGTTTSAGTTSTTSTTSASSTEDSGTSGTTTEGSTATTTEGSGCGDGILDAGEECDDGNAIDDDGCTNACLCLGVWAPLGGPLVGDDDGFEFGLGLSLSDDGATLVASSHVWGDPVVIGKVQAFHLDGGAWGPLGASVDGIPTPEYLFDDAPVALSGDGGTFVVGVPYAGGNGEESGLARVFRLQGGEWIAAAPDLEGALGDNLGGAVALSHDGKTAVIGSPSGIVGDTISRVNVYDLGGGAWKKIGAEISDQTYDGMGAAVAIRDDGTTIAVGLPFKGFWPDGEARTYQLQQGAWTQQGASLASEATYDYFGSAIAMSADGATIIVGAPENDGVNGMNSGHARVFRLVMGEWTQLGSDIDGEEADDEFAGAVAISGDGEVVLVGSHYHGLGGQVRAFRYDGADWVQRGADLVGAASGGHFGRSVAMSADGKTIAVGAPREIDVGRVHVYRWCE